MAPDLLDKGEKLSCFFLELQVQVQMAAAGVFNLSH